MSQTRIKAQDDFGFFKEAPRPNSTFGLGMKASGAPLWLSPSRASSRQQPLPSSVYYPGERSHAAATRAGQDGSLCHSTGVRHTRSDLIRARSSYPAVARFIGAQTNITVFLQGGVPAELRLAALRRAWTADPAIRDFKEMGENDWDFNDLNSIPGFGELGPEIDVNIMVAQVFGEPVRLAALPHRPIRAQFFGFLLPFAWN